MVQEGFKETAKKVDMEAGFKKVNDRLDKVDCRLDAVEQELVNVRGLPNRVKKLEEALEIE